MLRLGPAGCRLWIGPDVWFMGIGLGLATDHVAVVVELADQVVGLLQHRGFRARTFTGAMQTVPGRFEQADGGTLFLDEIGNMPLPFQQKLLRVVEYGTFTRVGGRAEVTASVRIVSATNVDLAAKIARGEFLADLFDRLAFETIELPPLRDRTEDLADLASHFLDLLGRELPALRGKRLAADALASLQRYSFPGNLRELKNLLERAAYRDTGAELTAADLGLDTAPQVSSPASEHGEGSFRDRITALERRLLVEALEGADGNQAEAARRLGLTYDQFRHYARKHRLGQEP